MVIKQTFDTSTNRRGKALRSVVAVLSLVYLFSLAGSIYIAISYEQYLGPTSAVQGWLDQNGTSYNTDIYDGILSLKEVSLSYYHAQTNKKFPISEVLERVEYFRGMLETFEPSTIAGKQVGRLRSAMPALELSRKYVDLVEAWAKTNKARTPDPEILTAEGEALTAMRKLSIEAGNKEFDARDEMAKTIISSRELANSVFKVALALYAVGAFALCSVYWASGAWIEAERTRFKRLEYLLATVGHDLRSPLQAIVSAAKLLTRTFAHGDNATYVEIIKDSASQLASLVDDLVDLARNQELSYTPQVIELGDWLEKITARFKLEAGRKSLQFNVIVDSADLPNIVFDPTRLTQCIGNLLSNAIRYTKTGSVTLKISVESTGVDEGMVEVDVVDTGPGIAVKDRERIFLPFVRTSADAEGMGLGLSIVTSIVRAAQGTIKLVSEVGSGSTFIVRLPVKFAPADDRNSKLSEGQDQVEKRVLPETQRVLIVEDNKAIRTVLAALVSEMGYTSDQASNGAFALTMAMETKYHAIITDIQMPVLDGFGLAAACRDRLNPCPGLIAMSAYTNELKKDQRAALFDKTLSKPVHDEDLLAALEAIPVRQ